MIIIQDLKILFDIGSIGVWKCHASQCKSKQVFSILFKFVQVFSFLQESMIVIEDPKILFDISSIRVWKCHASLCKSVQFCAILCKFLFFIERVLIIIQDLIFPLISSNKLNASLSIAIQNSFCDNFSEFCSLLRLKVFSVLLLVRSRSK